MNIYSGSFVRSCHTEFAFLQGILTPHVLLSGGALRNLFSDECVVKDYDIFFLDTRDVPRVKRQLLDRGFRPHKESVDRDSYTYRLGMTYVQLLAHRAYGSIEALLESFDFDICQMAYDGANLYVCDGAVDAAREKRVKLVNLTFPLSTLNRIYRYELKGYDCREAKTALVKTLSQGFTLPGRLNFYD